MSPERLENDPELAALFAGEPEVLELAQLVQSGRPDAPLRPDFQAQLRHQLFDAAPQALRRRGLFGGLFRPRPLMAGSLATLGAAMAAVTVVSVVHHNGGDTVVQNVQPVASIAAGAVNVNPDQAITIAFDQPMDQTSVERAVHIAPATAYTTSWHGNTLTITPQHHLASSAAYVVSLDSHTARAKSGAKLASTVVIPFGTKPVTPPPPTPTATPALAERVLGQALPGSALAPGPNGDVLAGSGLAAPQSTASPSASPSATTASNANATPSATPTTTASPGGSAAVSTVSAPQPQLIRLGGGTSTVLGAATAAVALSPAEHSVASLASDGDHADVVIANLDGSNRRVLSRDADAASPLGWTTSGVLFVRNGQVRIVDLSGITHTPALPAVTPGGPPLLVRDGNRMVLLSEPATQGSSPAAGPTASPTTSTTATPAATPTATATPSATTGTAAPPAGASIVDLGGGSALSLPAGASAVATSRDGTTVAWVVRTAAGAAVQRAAVPATLTGASLQPANVAIAGSVKDVKALALSPNGSVLAASVIQLDGASQLRILDASGHVLAAGGAVDSPVFVSNSAIAGLAAGGSTADVVLAAIGANSAGGADPNAVPVNAGTLLDHLIAAQSPAQPAALAALPTTGTPGPDVAGLTPAGITQAYAVAVSAANGGASVTAQVRLLHIPDASEPTATVTVADETATLRRAADGAYAIGALNVSPLTPQVTGPHVLRAQAGGVSGARTLTITFDSDLDAGTVQHAVTVSGIGEGATAIVSYNAQSRSVVVTLPGGLADMTRLTITVDTTLHDIDGNALNQPYSTTVLS